MTSEIIKMTKTSNNTKNNMKESNSNKNNTKESNERTAITFIPYNKWSWNIQQQKKNFVGVNNWSNYTGTIKGSSELYAMRTGYISNKHKNIVVLDFDKSKNANTEDGEKLMKILLKEQVINDDTYIEKSLNGGYHYFYEVSDDIAQLSSAHGVIFNNKKYAFDIQIKNSLIFCAGSKLTVKKNIEDEGEEKYYTYIDGKHPETAEELQQQINLKIKNASIELNKFLKTYCLKENETKEKNKIEYSRKTIKTGKLNEYLNVINKKFGQSPYWIRVMMVINKYNNSKEMFNYFVGWSRKAKGYEHEPRKNILKKWVAASKLETDKIKLDINYIYNLIRNSNINYYRQNIYKEIYNDDPENLKNYVSFNEDYITNNETFNTAAKNWMDNSKSLILKSNLGTGKTTFLCNIVKKFKRVLILSHRRTFNLMHYGNLKKMGFISYLKASSDEQIINADKLIISLEQLPKLINDQLLNFDLVVLDEAESILYHASSSTLYARGGDIQTLQNIKKLSKDATKILYMDAHISARTTEFVRSIDENFLFVENKNYNIKRTIKFYNNSQLTRKQIFLNIKNDKKIVIVCESKTDVDKLTSDIKLEFPNKIIKSYTSATPTSERAELENVNEAWKNVDVLIYNSTIEAGLSYDNIKNMFYKMYVICREETNSPRGLVQQILRIRQLQDNNIICDIGGKIKFKNTENYIWTFEEMHRKNEIITDESINNVLTWNALESKNKDVNTFYFMFCKYLTASGFNIDESCLLDENKPLSNRFNKQQQEENREETLNRLIKYVIPDDIKEIETKIKNGKETIKDIEIKDLFYMQAADNVKLTDDNKEKTAEYLNLKLSNKNIIKNACEIIEPKLISDTTDIHGNKVISLHTEQHKRKNEIRRNILKELNFQFDNSNNEMTKNEYEELINTFTTSKFWKSIENKEFINVMGIKDKRYKKFSENDIIKVFNTKFNNLFENVGIKVIQIRKREKGERNMTPYFKFIFDKKIDELISGVFDKNKTPTEQMKKFIKNTEITYWSDVIKKKENFNFVDESPQQQEN